MFKLNLNLIIRTTIKLFELSSKYLEMEYTNFYFFSPDEIDRTIEQSKSNKIEILKKEKEEIILELQSLREQNKAYKACFFTLQNLFLLSILIVCVGGFTYLIIYNQNQKTEIDFASILDLIKELNIDQEKLQVLQYKVLKLTLHNLSKNEIKLLNEIKDLLIQMEERTNVNSWIGPRTDL